MSGDYYRSGSSVGRTGSGRSLEHGYSRGTRTSTVVQSALRAVRYMLVLGGEIRSVLSRGLTRTDWRQAGDKQIHP